MHDKEEETLLAGDTSAAMAETLIEAREHGSTSKEVASQGIKFIISGAISAVVDLGLTALFQYKFGLGEAGARTIGFIFGTIVAYMINRRWTFKAEPSAKRMVQVAVLYCITYFVNVFGYKYLFIAGEHIGIKDVIATVIAFCIAQGVATVINFVVQRVWIFRHPR